MAAEHSGEADPNSDILRELQRFCRSFHRRAASLSLLPRASAPATAFADDSRLTIDNARADRRSGRHSSWRFLPQIPPPRDDAAGRIQKPEAEPEEKRGIWRWKPMRALAHIAMRRLACRFSVDVIAIHRLPTSINGRRLSVAVRKKETKGGAVQTMPSLARDCSADFEETLSIRCHLHCSGGAGTGKPLKFDPRPFLISVVAIDSPELDFGKNSVDLSSLVKESIEKNYEGKRIRQWSMSFQLSGEAMGGELLLKLAFQISDDGRVGIYKQAEVERSWQEESFSSEYLSTTAASSEAAIIERPVKEIEDFIPNKFDHKPSSVHDKKLNFDEELDDPEFEVIDKGVEFEQGKKSDTILDSLLTELDQIAGEAKASDSMMQKGPADSSKTKTDDEMKRQTMEVEEEMVMREFFNMLKLEDEKKFHDDPNEEDSEEKAYLSDLGEGLGCVVQTKDGGYLISMNPFNVQVARNETPKLAMQISRALILKDQNLSSGLEVIRRMAAVELEDQGSSKLLSLADMDELFGKTPEQIAFEGVASAMISGRNKEGGASSGAANVIANSKKMSRMVVEGRKKRFSQGSTWSKNDEPISIKEILAASLQSIEAMALDALKIQAEIFTDQEASLGVSRLTNICALGSAFPFAEWIRTCTQESRAAVLVLVVQLRDPLRSYEAVGVPMMAVMQGLVVGGGDCNCGKDEGDGDEKSFKLASLDLGGLRLRAGRKESAWDGEKQRLTAMQWLMANGVVKGGGRRKQLSSKAGGEDMVWSISSRVTEDVRYSVPAPRFVMVRFLKD